VCVYILLFKMAELSNGTIYRADGKVLEMYKSLLGDFGVTPAK